MFRKMKKIEKSLYLFMLEPRAWFSTYCNTRKGMALIKD